MIGTIQKKSAGFTLIELLVVVSIISMLASIVLASLSTAGVRARDVRRLADLKQVQNALELYNSDNASYPSGPASVRLTDIVGVAPQYISVIPIAPNTTAGSAVDYRYWTNIPTQGYTMLAWIEKLGAWCRLTVGDIVPNGWLVFTSCSDI